MSFMGPKARDISFTSLHVFHYQILRMTTSAVQARDRLTGIRKAGQAGVTFARALLGLGESASYRLRGCQRMGYLGG